MPGLINRVTLSQLPLTASEVTSCVSGYALGMTALLTYHNPDPQALEGLFVYPLDEGTAVVGFEAATSRRTVTVQIKDKAKIDDTNFDSCSLPPGRAGDGSGRIMMDEDLERTVFVANLGMIPPLESISIFISTSSELQTLPSGVVRVLLPAVCVPRVPQPSLENASSFSSHQLRTDKLLCGSGSPEQGSRFCLAQLLDSEATNPFEYEFSFHLEIRGPCLLAGVESPTHEIRADADPSARSARSIVITLANKHTFDRPVEILIHPSEPHMPHVLMEEGDMTPAEYERHLKGKNDFIKGTKKDPSAKKKMEIIRKRLSKDIPHHAVIMLNFCPDLRTVQPDLRKAQGEFIFLVDCSRSMSGASINRAKDALLVVLKSLMPACLFNVIGFGSTFRTLFPVSQAYCEESLAIACRSIGGIRADMGGTNLLSPLKWVTRQPIHRGHPRLLFLLTGGAVSNTGKVLELLRGHSCATRCYSFGVGPNACRRLLRGLAAVSRGASEFLAEGERLQPKMIRSLKKAMAPVLSDVSVEWVFPESTEVLVSPVSTSCLFPGDSLVSYGVICDTSPYLSTPRSDKRRRYSMMHSQESGSSVFFHSQEEAAGLESWNHSRDSEGSCPAERSPDHLGVGRDPGGESDTDTGVGSDVKALSRRRAYSTTQICDREPRRKAPTASDPGTALVKNPLRKTQLQDLQQLSPEPWQVDFQPLPAIPPGSATRIRGAGARRPALLQRSCVSFCHDASSPALPDGPQETPARGLEALDAITSLRSSSDSRSPGDLESAQHPSLAFETETSSDWEPQDLDIGAACGSPRSPRTFCKAVVKGLRNNEPVQWEVTFDIHPLFQERQSREDGDTDLWSETFHHLAAKSLIQDFEQLAERECEIEHGSGRRFQLNAVHTSKSCNVISKYTAFVPVDLSTSSYLPTLVQYTHTGAKSKPGNQRKQKSSGNRRHRGSSPGRPQSACGQNGDYGFYSMNAESSPSPSSTPSSSAWERCRAPEGLLHSLSASSAEAQKSIERLFAARLTLNKTMLLLRAAKGFMSKSPSRGSEAGSEGDSESVDYLPLVSLQLACGAFLLNSAFCDAVNIPMEKLKWTSPFACHRLSLSPSGSYSTKKNASSPEHKAPNSRQRLLVPSGQGKGPSTGGIAQGAALEDAGRPRHSSGSAAESISRALKAREEPAIAIRSFSSPAECRGWDAHGSELQASLLDAELQRQAEPEGMLWATAVALAWLEHSSASYFIEWELVAAKASLWLGGQRFPEGSSLAAVKAAAQQLFVLLRHWDENLEFNLLCYNPGSV
ncbi:von Willebrand factor A domain-containing protein 5B1 [Hirundo rustica]|uniref:von Willebrand factor A domain-containing protein 5B1 n=1 Tax=Hirundo rustica TaxID=43150 RepID=UPI001A94DB0D|nr:von Willebrand factor A domain-containing protein 5B1 [Hirundo rustica]XP_039940681.1 von Willebrand factor A domain-containing protein 5B1 [Hirundo rustica]XP_058279320.1 von Willebrand factor A domain-containing protein 5B1 [Hirundo rustica]